MIGTQGSKGGASRLRRCADPWLLGLTASPYSRISSVSLVTVWMLQGIDRSVLSRSELAKQIADKLRPAGWVGGVFETARQAAGRFEVLFDSLLLCDERFFCRE